MKHTCQLLLFLSLCGMLTGCSGQTGESMPSNSLKEGELIGGPFENSEFTYYGISNKISSVDTSAAWFEGGERVLLTGVVIHMTVKEDNDINEYYIDDILFEDDPLLTPTRKRRLEDRCGSGIVRLVQNGELLVGERNITLGLNIPGYPTMRSDH